MKLTGCVTLLALAGLTGCQETGSGLQTVNIDDTAMLQVRVEGARSRAVQAPSSTPGGPVHRILENNQGKVLFAYDLEVAKSGTPGVYRFRLKPAQQQPTLASAREVTVQGHESVRVELMERPGTSEKIEDVFWLTPRNLNPERSESPMAHLRQLHNALYRWVHGS